MDGAERVRRPQRVASRVRARHRRRRERGLDKWHAWEETGRRHSCCHWRSADSTRLKSSMVWCKSRPQPQKPEQRPMGKGYTHGQSRSGEHLDKDKLGDISRRTHFVRADSGNLAQGICTLQYSRNAYLYQHNIRNPTDSRTNR
jgi:hypothetical protein